MAVTADSNTAINSLNWAQQAAYTGVAGAVGTAATPRTKKTKREQAGESWFLSALFPIAAIQSGIEEGLKTSIRDAIGTLNTLLTDSKMSTSLQKLLGQPDDPTTIARSLHDLTDAFAEMAATPGQSARNVVRAATAFTNKLKTTTAQIQALRGQADSDIASTVGKANAILKRIADLNTKVTLGAAAGQPTRDIGVERDAALDTLSGSFDFASFNRDDGTISIFTKTGTPLVNGTAAELSHKITERIDASMTLANGRLSGVTADGVDISAQLSAGTLHALLKTRDSILPNVQGQLDTLAQTLQAQVNQVSNRALGGKALLSCRSSRRFADPGGQYFSLSGGDVMISLLAADGKPTMRTGLSLLMKQYLQANGLPCRRAWSAGQVAAALNRWLVQKIGSRAEPYAAINEEGQIAFHLPQGISTGLVLHDQRSIAYQSVPFASAEKPLGFSGPINFIDGACNAISTSRANPPRPIVATDTLADIAAKLDSLDGIEAQVAPTEGGVILRLTGTTGSDISVDPDPPGANVVVGLGLRPASDQPAEDVVVNYQPDRLGVNVTSAPLADALTPLGLTGVITMRDQDDALVAQVIVDAGWSLATVAARINDAAKNTGIVATVLAAGNQVVMKIAPPLGQQLRIGGVADAYHTHPMTNFVAAGGFLTIAADGAPVGRLTVNPGDGLQAIADAVNAQAAPFRARGISASLGQIGAAHYLEIASATGLPLSFDGSATGQAAGTLNFALNVRDRLGLSPPATQVVSGFANFLGLNDIFVADPPDAFDSKAPTGIFTSTAIAGTAGTLALNPLMQGDPAHMSDATLAAQMADILREPVNLAAAGGLARGSHGLVHYAEKIIATAAAQGRTFQGDLVFQQTLLDGLALQHSRIGGMDMNDTVTTLTTYQQAFHDSSRIVSTMAQLFGSLGAAIH